jgi:hypothetical protein
MPAGAGCWTDFMAPGVGIMRADRERVRAAALRSAVSLAALAVVYKGLARRRILTWGATVSEAAARLPGDELLTDADGVSTRAIEIFSRNRFRLPTAAGRVGMLAL